MYFKQLNNTTSRKNMYHFIIWKNPNEPGGLFIGDSINNSQDWDYTYNPNKTDFRLLFHF